jgi:rRNA-processing protein FCF1
MAVVLDSTFLIDIFNPKISGDQRIGLDLLISQLSKTKTKALIPAPCLTELLIHADKASAAYNEKLNTNANFEIIPFDRRAATECALLLAQAWDKKLHKGVTRTKFKYDWMIVACATSRSVETIYSDDADIANCAKIMGLRVIRQQDLLNPPKSPQGRLI